MTRRDRKDLRKVPNEFSFTDFVVLADGERRRIGTVLEATECLIGSWPEAGRGEAYRKALDVCSEVLAGTLPITAARSAFIFAAKQARLFMRLEPARRR